ncbi:MAG: phosphatase PAP2 family protein [Eubacterium sp.]|jgi:undecaprenyl-diphosphatase|nr:phosphatase PAP2 family protein [Eubacterium sp.]
MPDSFTQWEGEILLYIQDHIRTEWLDPVMIAISSPGKTGAFFIALCIALMIPKKTRRVGMIASLALLFSFLLNNVTLKSIVGRPRPYDTIEGLTLLSTPEIDTSFPSGHTSCAVSVGLAILLAAKRKWPGIIMMAFAALMAFSRLYLGAHYPSDVLTAIVTATLMTFLALFVFRKLEKAWKDRHPEKPEEPPKEDPPPEEGMA